MPIVGKSFTSIGKNAFSPIVLGRRGLLLKTMLAFRETGWRKASELPFHSLELIWAAERGLIIVRVEAQWCPPGGNPPCVKAVFEASGPFLYRRCITALLQHPLTPMSWQTTPGRSDWTTPFVVQFKLSPGFRLHQTAVAKLELELVLAELKADLEQLEKRFDYNGRGGVFDGRSTKQSQEDAFRLADAEFLAVKLNEWKAVSGFEDTYADDVAASLAKAIGKSSAHKPGVSHNEAFTTVIWFGDTYIFSSSQAAVVKLLWEAWERGGKQEDGVRVATHDLLMASGSGGRSLRDVFKPGNKLNPAWEKMITYKGCGRNHYKLSPKKISESTERPLSPPNA